MSASNLDALVLNTDRVVRLDQMVLDFRQLNATVVGGKSAYNANDLTYNSTVSTYDGVLTQLAYGSSVMGAMSATASSVPNVPASASSVLGGLVASINAQVSVLVSATAPLGSLTGTATTLPVVYPICSASFGSLSATATSLVSHSTTAISSMQGMNATANTIPQVLPLFTAPLGAITSTAISTVTDNVGANAPLGDLAALATATVIHPEPPAPSEPAGHYRPYYPVPVVEPTPLPEPPPVAITESLKAEPVLRVQLVTVAANQVKIESTITAQSRIEWSILEDEAELLLLL